MDTATLTPSSLFCAKTLISYMHGLDFIQCFLFPFKMSNLVLLPSMLNTNTLASAELWQEQEGDGSFGWIYITLHFCAISSVCTPWYLKFFTSSYTVCRKGLLYSFGSYQIILSILWSFTWYFAIILWFILLVITSLWTMNCNFYDAVHDLQF